MLVYQEGSSSESWMVLKMKPPNGHVQFTSRGQRTRKPPGFSGIIRFCASVRRARSRFWTNSLNPNGFSLNLRETCANIREHAKPVKSLRKRAWCPVQPFREFQRKLRGSVVLNAAPLESGVPFSDTISGCWRQSHPPKTSPVLFFQATI